MANQYPNVNPFLTESDMDAIRPMLSARNLLMVRCWLLTQMSACQRPNFAVSSVLLLFLSTSITKLASRKQLKRITSDFAEGFFKDWQDSLDHSENFFSNVSDEVIEQWFDDQIDRFRIELDVLYEEQAKESFDSWQP